jgi:hypothetical protein
LRPSRIQEVPVRKRIPAVFAVLLASCIVELDTGHTQSEDPWVGTWKVNLEKSTFSPGPKPTNPTTVKVESSAGGVKITMDGMTAEGKPFHTETVAGFDGKDNPVKGANRPNTTVAYKRIDDRTLESQSKIDGKPTTTVKISVSPDGKTLTATVTGKNADGQAVNSVIVHDKQ